MSWSNNGDLLISCNPTLAVLDVESIVAFPSYSNILLAKMFQLFVCSTLRLDIDCVFVPVS